jgi:hypothetical protein
MRNGAISARQPYSICYPKRSERLILPENAAPIYQIDTLLDDALYNDA